MSKYFSYFPKTVYGLNSLDVDAVTNIVSRFGFEQSFKNNSSVYYEYDIQDGDTPEIIASKFYNSPDRYWVILMINDIVDPQFDFPLDQRTIISFIDEKYSANANIGQSGIAWAQSNVKAYYKVETRTTISTDTELKNRLEIDANTYANVASSTSNLTLNDGNIIKIAISKETESYYDYEVEQNESKRTIKLLKPEFVSSIEEELRSVFN